MEFFSNKSKLKAQEKRLIGLHDEYERLSKKYNDLELRYRELLTKHELVDNIDDLIVKRSELFREIQELENRLNGVRESASEKDREMMTRYEAKNLYVAIIQSDQDGLIIKVFNYYKGAYYKINEDIIYYNFYKDIDCEDNHIVFAKGKLSIDDSNVKVLGYVRYSILAKLLDQKLPRDGSVSLLEIKETLKIFDNFDLTKVNMEEIVYSLKSIQKNKRKSRVRRLEK